MQARDSMDEGLGIVPIEGKLIRELARRLKNGLDNPSGESPNQKGPHNLGTTRVALARYSQHIFKADNTLVEHFQAILGYYSEYLGEQAAKGRVEFRRACQLGEKLDQVFWLADRTGPWELTSSRMKISDGLLPMTRSEAVILGKMCYKMAGQAHMRTLTFKRVNDHADVFRRLMRPYGRRFLLGTLELIITPDMAAKNVSSLSFDQQATLAAALAKVDVLITKEVATVASLIDLRDTIRDVLEVAGKPVPPLTPHEERADKNVCLAHSGMPDLIDQYIGALKANELKFSSLAGLIWLLNYEIAKVQ